MSNQQVGYRPAYQRLCKYCKEIDIVLVYEHIGNNRWTWRARNYNTGTLHDCRNRRRINEY